MAAHMRGDKGPMVNLSFLQSRGFAVHEEFWTAENRSPTTKQLGRQNTLIWVFATTDSRNGFYVKSYVLRHVWFLSKDKDASFLSSVADDVFGDPQELQFREALAGKRSLHENARHVEMSVENAPRRGRCQETGKVITTWQFAMILGWMNKFLAYQTRQRKMLRYERGILVYGLR